MFVEEAGAVNSSSISGGNSNDSPIATAVEFKANFRGENEKRGLWVTRDFRRAKISPTLFPDPPPSFGFVSSFASKA